MSITLAPQYTRRYYTWTDWKVVQAAKGLIYQYDDDGVIYTIYGYDGPEVNLCQIWIGTVPSTIIANSTITQAQNDLDKADFETNYEPTANQPIDNVDQQRGSICEVDFSNFYMPAGASDTFYQAISLDNLD